MAEPDIDVSVIVAVHNGAATLEQCIDSVLNQAGCHVELIIVDALSDDGTREIVESYGDAIATYIREADTGIYDAWNKALKVVRGEWCSFLGADDSFSAARSVALLLDVARRPGKSASYVYGGVRVIGAFEDTILHPEPGDPIAFLRRGQMLPHPGALHRRQQLVDIGGFDDSYRSAGDLPAVLALARLGAVRRCDHVVTDFRFGGISSSASTRILSETEWFRFLVEERGRLTALCLLALRRTQHGAGNLIEATLARILGRSRGGRAFLFVRRALKRPPRMTQLRRST